MKIRIDRPTDPELARLWDEAKRACEERGKLPLTIDDETRPIWEAAKRAAAEVAAWPAWKHTEQPADEAREQWLFRHREYVQFRNELLGESQPDSSCCVGDRSQCRCSPERGGWSDEDVEREWLQVWEGDEVEP